jgi:hypothetical protein
MISKARSRSTPDRSAQAGRVQGRRPPSRLSSGRIAGSHPHSKPWNVHRPLSVPASQQRGRIEPPSLSPEVIARGAILRGCGRGQHTRALRAVERGGLAVARSTAPEPPKRLGHGSTQKRDRLPACVRPEAAATSLSKGASARCSGSSAVLSRGVYSAFVRCRRCKRLPNPNCRKSKLLNLKWVQKWVQSSVARVTRENKRLPLCGAFLVAGARYGPTSDRRFLVETLVECSAST